LGTGLLASFVGFQTLTLAGQSAPEFNYVPRDVQFLAFANVRRVMDSELRRTLSELRPGVNNEADQFKQHTGIDTGTDIDSVVATWLGAQGHEGPPLVIARGRFDDAQIESLIMAQGGVAEDYNGKRLLMHEQEMFAVVFLEPGLAAIGSPSSVRTAIDTQMSGTNVTGNEELMRLVGDIDDGDLWTVARFDALAGGPLPTDVVTQLPSISWFSAKGFIDSGVQGQLRVEARDEESARNLQDVVRGFVALARLQVSQQAGLGQVIDSLQLAGEGKTVSLSFSVTSELIIQALGVVQADGDTPTQPLPAPEPTPEPAL
jgi:hypothetical protein